MTREAGSKAWQIIRPKRRVAKCTHARTYGLCIYTVSLSIRIRIRGRSGRPQCFSASNRDSINEPYIFSVSAPPSITIGPNRDRGEGREGEQMHSYAELNAPVCFQRPDISNERLTRTRELWNAGNYSVGRPPRNFPGSEVIKQRRVFENQNEKKVTSLWKIHRKI